jgi:adenosyl cobinamide kinase/adenosyl cobinamide phosphate guanylyltransferase
MATHQPQTERVTYLTNAEQKAALEAFARARGESVGSVLRDAVAEYLAQPSPEEEAELIALTQQVNEAIPRMAAAMDAMSAQIRVVNEEVGAMLRAKGYR